MPPAWQWFFTIVSFSIQYPLQAFGMFHILAPVFYDGKPLPEVFLIWGPRLKYLHSLKQSWKWNIAWKVHAP